MEGTRAVRPREIVLLSHPGFFTHHLTARL
jgi:hypothetical protein